MILFNTLVVTGVFEKFRRWLSAQGTADVRVQAMLFAWAFGALLEGLVGFGYPWAFVAPILISLGIPDLDAIRVAAIANNAPVSYGALGAPIIGSAAVTGLPLLQLSGSVGHVVAVLALLPPWVLIYLVSGKKGFRDGWPLAIVGDVRRTLTDLLPLLESQVDRTFLEQIQAKTGEWNQALHRIEASTKLPLQPQV